MAEKDSRNGAGPEDGVDAIPVSGIKPLWLGLGAGVVLLGVLVTAVVKMSNRGHTPKHDDTSEQAALQEAEQKSEDAKEQKEHLLTTQRSLARLAEEQKAAAAASAAAAAQAEQAHPVAAAPVGGGAGPAPAAAKPKPNPKAASKLDSIGDDIAGQLK
ncbi:MAG: hypothetical protein OZ921_12985 [Sorangiineae bacterium]|nr:hypothetical protein [Polyangiaceae bacterium]MEB2323423.1 hypothetical protein [Sorangiineae bacterium]